MRILAVSHEFPPIGGGGANACYFLTKGFVEHGHQVTLVTANYNGLPQEELINGVSVHRVNSIRKNKEHCSFKEMLSYLCRALPVVERLQKQESFDLCLVFFGIPSGPIGYWLKYKYKLPYIIRFGGGDVPGFQERFTKVYRVIAPAIRRIWDKADARVANSKGLRDMALGFYSKNSFDIISNGVDTQMFAPAQSKKNDIVRILFVSRLIERKGLQYIIPCLKEIENKSGKKIKLIVVGDGPYRAVLEELADKNGVSHMIDFIGQVDKAYIVPYYQNADLFILPSAKEGMPNVVLEAMACGLPILMTPCEGSEELVTSNGIVCNIDHFNEQLIDMISSGNLSTMGENSRKIACEEFTWDRTVKDYLDLMMRITLVE